MPMALLPMDSRLLVRRVIASLARISAPRQEFENRAIDV